MVVNLLVCFIGRLTLLTLLLQVAQVKVGVLVITTYLLLILYQLQVLMELPHMFVLIVGLVDSISNISPVGSKVSAGLPNIFGEIKVGQNAMQRTAEDGSALYGTQGKGHTHYESTTSSACASIYLNASLCNNIYSNSETVTPKSLVVQFLIKY